MEYIVRKELKVEVYTIGYEPEGEGVVVKIKSDGTTKFCLVIDCYEIGDNNQTLDIIKNEKINLICITHPDEDHCKGLEKVLSLATKDTTILYPSNMLEKEYESLAANRVKKELARFLSMNKNNSNKPRLRKCIEMSEISQPIKFWNFGDTYELKIKTYSPITSLLDRGIGKEILGKQGKIVENNELSIMMSIELGTLKLLFCGDIENNTICEVNSNVGKGKGDFFNRTIDYVKIPHHSSIGSIEMFKLFSNVSTISNSVTTVYRPSNLPNIETLKMYKEKSGKLFCTSQLNENENKKNYGIIQQTFDVINQTVKTEELEGNATEIVNF